MLKQFAMKKSVKLGKLLKEMGAFDTVEHMEAQFAATDDLRLDSNSENDGLAKVKLFLRVNCYVHSSKKMWLCVSSPVYLFF